MSQIEINNFSSINYQLKNLVDNICKDKLLIIIKHICDKFSQARLFIEEIMQLFKN